jgi:glycosyltransferase 2 family protein
VPRETAFDNAVRTKLPLKRRFAGTVRLSTALPDSPVRTAPRWSGLIKLGLRVVIGVLVIWGIWYTVEKALASLRQEDYSLAELARLDWKWVAASAAFYVAAMAPSCLFWRKVLQAMGQDPPTGPLVRAYFIGHLGKYVPGKAMVLVLRAGLLRGSRVDTTVAVVSVFVETLTLMAVGACFALALVAVQFREHPALLILGAAVTLGAGVPMLPPVFRRLVMVLQVKRLNPQIEHAIHGLGWRVTFWGWALMLVAWCLMALSLWAVVKSIPGAAVKSDHLPIVGAAVALAMVAGFASFIPGGLGVREVVVIPLLAPLYGNVIALVSAVLLRMVWLLAELVTSGLVYLIPTPPAEAQLTRAEQIPSKSTDSPRDCMRPSEAVRGNTNTPKGNTAGG